LPESEAPTLRSVFGGRGPYFLRKLTRKRHWGDPKDPFEDRIRDAVSEVFKEDPDAPGRYSVYRAESDIDLQRIAGGMNSRRGSLKENIDLVAFLPSELGTLAIHAECSLGETKCVAANKLHFDLLADRTALTKLCRNAMKAQRAATRVSKKDMATIIKTLESANCQVVSVGNEACSCVDNN